MLSLWFFVACDDSLLVDDRRTKDGTTDDTGTGRGDPCADGTPERTTIPVVFEAIDDACPWGEGDNLAAEDAHCTARREQTESIDIGTGAVICDVSFDFLVEGGEIQRMVYDDNFWFTFDDVVLAGSYGPFVERFPVDGELPIYDWDSIAGEEFSFDEGIPTFCLGEAEGLAECTIPAPETEGRMALDFDASIVAKLSTRAVQTGRIDYGFIAWGDNDQSDCSHEEFAFDVEIAYVTR